MAQRKLFVFLLHHRDLSGGRWHIVHELGPIKGGHWYHKNVQINIVIFDKVYVYTTYFCMIAVCM